MSDKKQLKVGDKLVDFGQVFRIFKIEKKKNSDGEEDRILHFRPFFKSDDNKGMVCSIPESSLQNTNMRRPITKDAVQQIVDRLKHKPKNNVSTDVDSVKQVLSANDPHQTVEMVRTLWIEQVTSESFTKSKKDVFELATLCLVEEVALASNTTPDKAHDKLTSTLKRAHK